MNEFELIQRYFARENEASWCVLGVGDDAAVLQLPADRQLVICSDTLVAGRHFSHDTAAEDIGYKSLAVNLSDLAAMGAEPLGFLLNLTIPSADETFVAAFASGLFALAARYDMALVGGDTTRGPLTISITAFGMARPGRIMRRDGARLGDEIAVVGDLGGAALALAEGAKASASLRACLDRPQPRISEGLALAGHAHAAIDVSDGLAADLSHVLRAGGLGAQLDLASLPMHPELAGLPMEQARQLALQGGDDYALCVCLAPEDSARMAKELLDYRRIGRVIARPGLWQDDGNDGLEPIATAGYQHFE